MGDYVRNCGYQSNKELMLYLKDSGYIRSNFIFDIMCSVDRKNFTTNNCTAYQDRPQAVAYEKTISAPHMHAIVLEQMSESLRQGKCALDIGSGSGYLTICMALAIREKGRVIGVDCIPGFKIMANQIAQNHHPELLQNNRVEYIVYDGRRGWPWGSPYDAIHVGVAAESIPETLIEQLAPGGCLVMPVGLGQDQVLVSLKKSLNGNIQKKELMSVMYGTFTEVDLPWSSMAGIDLILDQEIKKKNTPKSQASNAPMNELFAKENIKVFTENIRTDQHAENKTLENSDKKINLNKTNEDIDLKKLTEEIQCTLPNVIINSTNERRIVIEKIQIFENKDNDYDKSKSQEDIITTVKLAPQTILIEDPENITQSILTKAEKYDENLKTIKLNEDANVTNDSYTKPVKENMTIYKSVLELECTNPKTIEDDEKAQTVNEKNIDNTEKSIDELEKNICDSESSESQNVDSFSEDSDEVSSVDTEIDTPAFYEDCKNCDEILSNIQSNSKVYNHSKSLSKSLENVSIINEPNIKLRSSISTIIESDKNKTQTVREKIEIFEKNIQNCKVLNSQENVTIKIMSVSKENDNAVVRDTNENIQVLENSNIDEALRTGVTNVHTNQEIHNDSSPFSKSVENLIKTDESVSMSQLQCSTILHSDETETVQHKIDIVQENMVKNHNNVDKVVEKDQNQFSGEKVKKMEENEASRESISSEFQLFKNEIKVILNNFLSSEKEHHEEIKLRQVNLHIKKIHQLQLINNLEEKVESNSENSEQNEKPYENLKNNVANKKLSAENQDENSRDLQFQMRNISEKVEQLQVQYDNNIEKLMASNEELQGRIVHYENLEKRLQNLEKKIKLITRILAKLIDKTNCHEKVLSIQRAITGKEEASRIFKKLIREETEEKVDNVISAISRIGQEIKVIECNLDDIITTDKDDPLVEQSEAMSNTYVSKLELFLTELNLIKTLLHLDEENLDVENECTLNNEGGFKENESEMNLLKIILEEQ